MWAFDARCPLVSLGLAGESETTPSNEVDLVPSPRDT